MRRCRLLLFLLLTACGGRSADDLFEDYTARLARLAGVELADAAPPRVPAYPAARDLVLPAIDLRVNPAELLSLGECGLLGRISARNSPLGRLQRESGRLLYELDFFQAVEACGRRIGTEPAAAEFGRQLAAIREAKAANLPIAFWNASFGAREFRIFMDTATPALAADEALSAARFEEPLRRLADLGRRLETALPPEPRDFENVYFQLQADKTGGRIVRSLSLAAFHLERAAALLETAANQRLCPMGRKTETAGYFHNVFRKYYAGGIQPYVSRLHQAGAALQADIAELAASQRAEPPPAFVAWYAASLDGSGDASLWHRYDAALRRHTEAWRGVLKPCGLLPAGPLGG